MFLRINRNYLMSFMYGFMYDFIIKCIDLYTYLTMKVMRYLPSLIYTRTFTYKSNIKNGYCEIDFDIIEYKCNLNGRFYTVRFLDRNDKKEQMYDFTRNIKSKIERCNLITHACLMNEEKYIKDITDELRSFFHYINIDQVSGIDFINKLRKDNIWEYIKINVGMNENSMVICLNDSNLTELKIDN